MLAVRDRLRGLAAEAQAAPPAGQPRRPMRELGPLGAGGARNKRRGGRKGVGEDEGLTPAADTGRGGVSGSRP